MISSGYLRMPFGLGLRTSFNKGRSTGKSGPFKVRGCISFLGCVSQNPVMVVSVFFRFIFAKHQFSLGQLVTSAMTNFTRGKLTLQEHSKQNVHLMASMNVVDFKDRKG